MTHNGFDLSASARQEMIDQGFEPDFSSAVRQQIQEIRNKPQSATGAEVRDLRNLLWSSIDNDSSRDLDQAEVAERVAGGIRVLVAVADVDSDVAIDTPVDKHASEQTTS